MLDFLALAHECAPTVSPQTMAAVVNVESDYNPYAIGVVGGRLARQPGSLDEALATARQLASDGWNFSVGIAQVNRYNLPRYEITYEQAFDPCTSLRIGSKILEDCYVRASKRTPEQQAALNAAFSCYYSGNFTRGFKPDQTGKPSYVEKILASAEANAKAIPVVPSIQIGNGPKPEFDKAADSTEPVTLKVLKPKREAKRSMENAPVLLLPPNSVGNNSSGESPAPAVDKTVTSNPAIVF
ncbi:MAG TPA: lytic transglycosylase domain-containing protein [Oligoflexus sp.]|uniref:lytic transglycosylase domain-containing protein n=1 Tax=Oligoflexus sp. TaxID=1971216 RepID=UPI002D7F221B|nr:lytic transglycosylase domain-containing protein [Oligoflexus sp.]HET9239188.1 lytic transglycosylase domain-containing protein [Oligoflexus sp.]